VKNELRGSRQEARSFRTLRPRVVSLLLRPPPSASYDQARKRLGELSDDELYAFVPALAFGGAEDAASLDRCNWQVHREILRQLAT
jgi:hypothetical protein